MHLAAVTTAPTHILEVKPILDNSALTAALQDPAAILFSLITYLTALGYATSKFVIGLVKRTH